MNMCAPPCDGIRLENGSDWSLFLSFRGISGSGLDVSRAQPELLPDVAKYAAKFRQTGSGRQSLATSDIVATTPVRDGKSTRNAIRNNGAAPHVSPPRPLGPD